METEDLYSVNRETANPRAVELIPDDFFWDTDDEFAPFGSDEGFETLADYRDWKRDNPGAPLADYIKWLIESIGEMKPANYTVRMADRNLVRRQMKDETWDDRRYIYEVDTAVIAAGFTQLIDEGKIDADCKPWIQAAIARQKVWGDMGFSEDFRDVYIDNMHVLEKALKAA